MLCHRFAGASIAANCFLDVFVPKAGGPSSSSNAAGVCGFAVSAAYRRAASPESPFSIAKRSIVSWIIGSRQPRRAAVWRVARLCSLFPASASASARVRRCSAGRGRSVTKRRASTSASSGSPLPKASRAIRSCAKPRMKGGTVSAKLAVTRDWRSSCAPVVTRPVSISPAIQSACFIIVAARLTSQDSTK